MSSIQLSGLSFPYSAYVPKQYIEPGGSRVPHSSPIHYTHEEQDDHGDTCAHEERRRACVMRNALQTIRKHLGRFIIESVGGSLVLAHPAATSMTKVIIKMYKKIWPTYGALSDEDKKIWFELF
ncbi:unnamed protein product [Vicia faba]|uniref:Uncharacterized protein n=1 Tax=Vicia faba TaxID=3906 RepID=A0AAV0Z4G5_VICFA|nr:unnamed protein product [Vicia faba]